MTAPIKASDVPMQAGEPQKSAQWSTRIVGQGEEAPEQLLANPRNWRIHPKHQQDALQETLDRVGWVQSVIVNRITGHVIDGHLRVGLAISKGEETIPVSYVELDDEEERLVLATLDPLAGVGGTGGGAFKGVLGGLGGGVAGGPYRGKRGVGGGGGGGGGAGGGGGGGRGGCAGG